MRIAIDFMSCSRREFAVKTEAGSILDQQSYRAKLG